VNWAQRSSQFSIRSSRKKYGLELGSFIIENVSLPPEVEAAIDKRSSMAAIGNLNDYVKLQMADGLAKGGGGPGGAAAEIAMGFGMAQQMIEPAGRNPGAAGHAPGRRCTHSGRGRARLSERSESQNCSAPADAAKLLGVNEGDVVASLTDGSLKGKKIGSTWRITRTALDEFLKS